MATYVPNATQTTEPLESQTVESAALEFRTLKTSVNSRLATEIADRANADTNLQGQITFLTGAIVGGSVAAIVTSQEIVGDGITATYTLSASVDSSLHVDLYIDGAHQQPSSYTVVLDQLTLLEVPHAGALITVKIGKPIGVGTTDSSLVQYEPAGTGAVATTVQSKLREIPDLTDFGAVGNGVTDDFAAIQAALDAQPVGGVLRVSKQHWISQRLTFSTAGVKLMGDSGYFGPTGNITLDPASVSDELFNIQAAEVTIEGLVLTGKGKAVANSKLFTTARTDNVMDVDLNIKNCVISGVETVGILTGRGINMAGNTVTGVVQGIKLNWPNTLIEGPNAEQKKATGFRSINISGNRIHAGSGGYLVWNVETNHELVAGIHITNNYIDTICGVFRGTLQDATVVGNIVFNNYVIPFLSEAGFFIKGATISGNEFHGMRDNGYGATFEYTSVIGSALTNDLTFSGNKVSRASTDSFQFTGAASSNIAIVGNTFSDILQLHRTPTARVVLNIATAGIKGVTFSNNVISVSSEAQAALVAGDVLVKGTGTVTDIVMTGNQYPTGWKLSSVTPTAAKRKDIANQIYDGDGTAEKVIDLDFYPSCVIVSAITGASAGSMRLQLYGTSTGTTEVELRNGSVAVKGIYNTNLARYMLIAFQ